MNQPKFCASATWHTDAITFANNSTIGADPNTVFVSINNSIYVAESYFNQVDMWLEGSINPVTISGGLTNPYGLFVATNGDVYIDNGATNNRVDEWPWNTLVGVTVMYISGICCGLFVDISDNLYCSQCNHHTVAKASLNGGPNLAAIIAGNTTAGSASNMLNNPHGIFVDINFNLYVADGGNNRIQLFQSGQLNGTTVAGNETSSETIILNYPIAVILDADGYLFIADSNNDRIVGSGPNGFRCIVGCTGTSGSAPNQLNKPYSLSFDSYGNLFVTDRDNARIQKFLLATNSCGKYSVNPVTK